MSDPDETFASQSQALADALRDAMAPAVASQALAEALVSVHSQADRSLPDLRSVIPAGLRSVIPGAFAAETLVQSLTIALDPWLAVTNHLQALERSIIPADFTGRPLSHRLAIRALSEEAGNPDRPAFPAESHPMAWVDAPAETVASDAVAALEGGDAPESGDLHPLSPRECRAWAGELTTSIRRFRDDLTRTDGEAWDLIRPGDRRPVLALDYAFALWLHDAMGDEVSAAGWLDAAADRLEGYGRAAVLPFVAEIDVVLNSALDLVRPWISGAWARTLAAVVWDRTIRARVQTLRDNVPTTPVMLARIMPDVSTRSRVAPARGQVPLPLVYDVKGARDGELSRLALVPTTDTAIVQTLVDAFDHPHASELLRWCMIEGMSGHRPPGSADAAIRGGWKALSAETGFDPSYYGEVRDGAELLRATTIRDFGRGRSGALPLLVGWIDPYQTANGWSPLVLTLSPVTLPSSLHEGGEFARARKQDRYTVPVLERPRLGRDAIHPKLVAGALRADWIAMVRFRLAFGDIAEQAAKGDRSAVTEAERIIRHGAPLDWRDIADEARLPARTRSGPDPLAVMLEAFRLQGRWIEPSRGMWTLGPNHEGAIRSVIMGVARTIGGHRGRDKSDAGMMRGLRNKPR